MFDLIITGILAFKTAIVKLFSGILFSIVRFIVYPPTKERLRLAELVKRKQRERENDFLNLKSFYSVRANENAILALTWDELIENLQTRKLTATEVLEAYVAKSLEASDKCNPITEFIHQSFHWARELDNLPEVKGPLHGIPFCVKDDNDIQGLDTTLGYAKRLYQPAKESAVIVQVLMELGAIPFAKTNVPQTLWSHGSDNPIFGITKNGLNNKWSPGGSSSGTGALVGYGAAFFGTGTDIGGSLRAPAQFNGVSSIKPTSNRLSLKGCVSPLPKLVGVGPSLGIIGQNPSIVASIVSKILESNRQLDFDPMALPIPWNSAIFESNKKLRIGFFTSLPYFPLVGDAESMVLKAKAALESLGHTVIRFDMPDAYNFIRVLVQISVADQAKHLKSCWSNEEIADCVKPLYLGSLIPPSFLPFIRKILQSKFNPWHSKRLAAFLQTGAMTSQDLWDAIYEKDQIKRQILTEWDELKLDALICNVMPVPAPPLDEPTMLPSPYNVIFNLVDFPSGVVTMGAESGRNLSNFDDEGDYVLKLSFKGIKESIGAPIAIQVVGKPFQEEVVLRIMKELEPFNEFKLKRN